MSSVKGICPECEFAFEMPEPIVGETVACPECMLSLQVRGVTGAATLELEAVETSLDDWGE